MSVINVSCSDIEKYPESYASKLVRYFRIKPYKIHDWWNQYAARLNFKTMVIILDPALADPHINPVRFLVEAASNGQYELTRYFCLHKSVDPTALDNLALTKAVQNNRLTIVKLFVDFNLVDLAKNRTIMEYVIRFGTDFMAKILLDDSVLDYDSGLFFMAVDHGRGKIIQLLIKEMYMGIRQNKLEILSVICEKDNIKAVEILISAISFDDMNLYHSVLISIEHESIRMVEYLLTNIKINNDNYNGLLLAACKYNKLDILKFLMDRHYEYPRLGAGHKRYLIKYVCKKTVHLIKFLLEHESKIFSDCVGMAIRYVTRKENLPILEYLLSLNYYLGEMLDPNHKFLLNYLNNMITCINQNNIIDFDSVNMKNFHYEFPILETNFVNAIDKPRTLQLLLNSSKMYPSEYFSYVMIEAVRGGHEEAVKQLLNCDQINPSTSNGLPIILAAWYEHLPILKLFLTRPDIDINIRSIDFLINCVEYTNNYDVAKLLLEDPRLNLHNIRHIDSHRIRNMINFNSNKVGSLLLSHKLIKHYMLSIIYIISKLGIVDICPLFIDYYWRLDTR